MATRQGGRFAATYAETHPMSAPVSEPAPAPEGVGESKVCVESVSVRLAGNPILDGISLDVAPHEFLRIIGTSGGGKTTLLRSVAEPDRRGDGRHDRRRQPLAGVRRVIVVWFGFGPTAKTVVVMLFVLFPVLINTMRGVKEVDRDLIEVARSFGSGERRMWIDLILPSALPYVVTGLRLAIGRALIGVIVAEFFTAFAGLGNLIVTNANSFRTDRTFVPILLIALLGITLTALLEWVERRVVRWAAKD
jgi:hypothetical protein